MPGERSALRLRYRRDTVRLAKLMAVTEPDAAAQLNRRDARPGPGPDGYRKAGTRARRLYCRPFSRAFGHRLERLAPEQRALLLSRYRDGLSWRAACRKTGYSESGAMKVRRKTVADFNAQRLL